MSSVEGTNKGDLSCKSMSQKSIVLGAFAAVVGSFRRMNSYWKSYVSTIVGLGDPTML